MGMDRQIGSRLILLAAIVTMVVLAAISDVSRIAALAIGVPLAFLAAGALLIGVPYAAVEKAEGHRLRWKKLLDFFEHATVLAWMDLFVLWFVTGIAYMGLAAGAGTAYTVVFAIALVVGIIAAMRDLYLSEEPDGMQAAWQEHPQ